MTSIRIDQNLTSELLAKAKRKGATAADAVAVEGDAASVQVRLSVVDKLSKAQEKRLGLRVYLGQRSAGASTSDLSPASLDELVETTCALAQAVVEDPSAGLPDPAALAKERPDLDLYDSQTVPMDRMIELATRAEKAALAVDSRLTNSEGADFSAFGGRTVFANSHGFYGEYQSSSFSCAVAPIAVQDGLMQRDYWYAVGRKLNRLDSPEAVGQEAGRRTVRRLGARKIATCRVPVVFEPEIAGSFLGNLCSAVNGYAIYKGASYLVGRLGERIAPDLVTVYDDGRMPGGLGSKPFDGEGLPTRKNVVVERGILRSYLLDTYAARKLGLASTGSASRSVGEASSVGATNFYLTPGTATPDEIICSVKRGLYVTELIGFGINMVTGDYSRGAVGFWIENGELAYPVEEITIAGNLKDMWMGVEAIGNDLVFSGRIVSPTVKIAAMTVAGE
ncbi:MAG: TldD/PmbA family protein [Nitrospirae bacterium]|nr:MAG: TldD/PmbA family protein [Nitrospirota bacterium]